MRNFLNRFNRLFALALFMMVLFVPALPRALAASAWLNGDPYLLNNVKSVTHDDYLDQRGQKLGPTAGLKCIDKRIAKRSILSLNIQFEDTCWYNSKIGLISEFGNYILQPGTDVAGQLKTTSLDSRKWPILKPTPNPDIFLELVPSPAQDGYFLAFRHVDDVVLERQTNTFGDVTLIFSTPATKAVMNSNGTQQKISLGDISWSADAKYMLVYNKNGYLLRYNLDNYRVMGMQVSDSPTGNLGRGTAAISPSGNYLVATEERTNGNMYIVDLSSCESYEQDVIAKDSKCSKKRLRPLLQANIPGYLLGLFPRFFGEHTIGFYNYLGSTTAGYEIRYLQAFGTEFISSGYLALGDSFSSGEGAGDYIEGTDDVGKNMCHTSQNSYPYVINNRLNLSDFSSVACSGAVIDNYWFVRQQENDDPFSGRPGTRPQQSFLKPDAHALVTLSMSGNDIYFAKKLEYCILWDGDCYGTYEKRKQIVGEIQRQHSKLIDLYKDILGDSPDRKLYVLGYPSFVADGDDVQCGVNVQMNTYQRTMARDLLHYLNDVIESAAKQAGVFYVDVEDAFMGHRLCEGPSATLAANGITLGDDAGFWKVRFLSNNSFHPNILGHQLLASRTLSHTNNLTAPMPSPQDSPMPEAENYPFLNNVPKDNSVIHDLIGNHDPFGEKTLIERGRNALIEVVTPEIPLNPFGLYDVWLNSDPVYLGQVQADGAGLIRKELLVPEHVKPGIHELHVRGNGQDGKLIDVYWFLYVAAGATDFDGDGVLNEDEPCGILEPSGIDEDGDNMDDVCDPTISTSNSTDETATNQNGSPTTPVAPASTSPSDQTPTPATSSINEVSDSSQPKTLGSDSTNTPTEPEPTGRAGSMSGAKPSLNGWLVGGVTLVIILGYSVFSYARRKEII